MKSIRYFLLSALILSSVTVPALAYYHPDEGRWLSRDPIGELGGPNLYAYVENAPTQNKDALGLIGTFSILKFEPNPLPNAGANVRFKWEAPSSWDKDCPPCKKAVWIQDYTWQTWLAIPPFYLFSGWNVDWDENNYDGSAWEWQSGSSSMSDTTMWDDPRAGIAPYVGFKFSFQAESCVKCTAGSEKGQIYGCYNWGFQYVWPSQISAVFESYSDTKQH